MTAEILDGLYARITTEDQLDGPGVVSIHIESKLLIARQLFGVRILENSEVLIKSGLFILETLIVHRPMFHIFFEKRRIQAMIHLLRGP